MEESNLSEEIQNIMDLAKESGYEENTLKPILEGVFKHRLFRGQQLEVIMRILAGKSTLAILPTGKFFYKLFKIGGKA